MRVDALAQGSQTAPPVQGAHVDADGGGPMGDVAAARQHLKGGVTELLGKDTHQGISQEIYQQASYMSLLPLLQLGFYSRFTLSAHLLVGKEVDDGIIDRAGLGKVHGHGGEQWRDVELWIHDHHY